MPRRFALALLALLVLLLAGLLVGRSFHGARRKRPVDALPVPTRTIPPPPTPLPARLAAIWFESAEDGLFRGEAREVPAAVDDVALLRKLGAAVLEGPRHPSLLRPFPEGWTVRAAYRLADGLAVLDLAPPSPPAPTPGPTAAAGEEPKERAKAPTPAPAAVAAEPPKRWETGSSEELGAAQSLVLTVTKNLPAVTRVILLVGGEPVETLAGHVDLTHPLLPDLSRAADEPALVAPMPTPAPSPGPGGETTPAPASAAAPVPVAAPTKAAPPAGKPAAAPVPPAATPRPAAKSDPAASAPRPAARPTPPPVKNTIRT